MKSQISQEKHQLADKYEKINTEINEETHQKYQQKLNSKRKLAHFYEEQIDSLDSKRSLEKMENHKF